MVLNLTNKPLEKFSAFQRLALKGEPLESRKVNTYEEFEELYDSLSNVKFIIIDATDILLINDIINCVTCPVVTLDIESIVEPEQVNFLEYEY